MSIVERPASVDWEPLQLPEAPGIAVWAWYRPPQFPHGMMLQIPADAHRAIGPLLTMRRLLAAAGVALGEVQSWSVRGMAFDPASGQNPLLDQPLPPPLENDPGVLVLTRDARSPVAASIAMNPETERLFHAIDADWNAILQTEGNLALVRQQLNGLHGRLNGLNRDLSPEEGNHADSLMKREWQDARRWLRDATSQVSRSLREYDVGQTSAAGVRNRFEQLYNDWVKPRRPFENMAAVQKEFETHRRSVQNLLQTMSQALSTGARDGEQRAQQILARIAAKVRAAKTKR